MSYKNIKITSVAKKKYSLNLLYLLLLAFVLIVTTGFAANRKNLKTKVELDRKVEEFSSLPTLNGSDTFPVISAQAALAVDLGSGVTLYEKNPDEPLLPASTTKIITALVSLDYYPLDKILRVGDVAVAGQKMGLVKGEEISVQDLLSGLLIYSANDAAEALAQNYPGGREAFITVMNIKARQLGLEGSVFKNPSGLDGGGHLSTARDLVRLSSVAIKNETFAQIVATKEEVVKSQDGKISHKLVNLNKLVGEVEGVLGVKTGWTENARENLVTYIDRDGHRVMIALLGSQDRFGETKELIEWIFENYEWSQVSH